MPDKRFISFESVQPYLPMESCRPGHLYRVAARNASVGIYDAGKRGFIINREKFGRRYLFVEDHWDTGVPFGTAKPLEDLGPAPRLTGEAELLRWLGVQAERYGDWREWIEATEQRQRPPVPRQPSRETVEDGGAA